MKPIRDLHHKRARANFVFHVRRLIAVKPTLPDWIRDPPTPSSLPTFFVLVLNEMVLVLVIANPIDYEREHRPSD